MYVTVLVIVAVGGEFACGIRRPCLLNRSTANTVPGSWHYEPGSPPRPAVGPPLAGIDGMVFEEPVTNTDECRWLTTSLVPIVSLPPLFRTSTRGSDMTV